MTLLEEARRLVAAAASCAAGVRGGEMDKLLAALSNATAGIVNLDHDTVRTFSFPGFAMQSSSANPHRTHKRKQVCPNVPDLLCQRVIRPQLMQGVGKVWSILNESVFDVSYMKYAAHTPTHSSPPS